MPSPRTHLHVRDSGQAVVEAALVMPLMVFIMLGTMQLFLMMHARILTQLAAFQITRAGSLNHGNCPRMLHAGILQVLPAIEPFVKPSGSLSSNVANTFAKYSANSYNGMNINVGSGNNGGTASNAGGKSTTANGTILWVVRDITGRASVGATDNDFDQNLPAQRMETLVIFWYPMKIPFANWVMANIMLAHYGMQAYSNQNPLMIRQKANWTQTTANNLAAEVRSELQSRLTLKEYVFPIQASFTMRMMTPLKSANMVTKNCPGTPASL